MNLIHNVLVPAALLLAINSSLSAAETSVVPAASGSRPAVAVVTATQKAAKAPLNTSLGAAVRPVDINSAGLNELKTLPGVTDVVAEKIVSGRPFGSKSQLTTRGILPRDVYENLKGLVVAKQDADTTEKLLKK